MQHFHLLVIVFISCLSFLSHAKEDVVKINSIITNIKIQREIKNDSLDFFKTKANYLYKTGTRFKNEDNDSLALQYYLKCYTVCNKHTLLEKETVGVLISIANIYKDNGENKNALNFYNKCISGVYELSINTQAAIHNNLGNIYFNLGNLDSAYFYFEKSLFFYQSLNDSISLGTIFNNIGNIAFQRGDYQKSLIYYFKSISLKEINKDKEGVGVT